MRLGRLGLAGVEPQLEESTEILAAREHLFVPGAPRRQSDDADVVVAAAVAAFVGGRFVERRQRSSTAEKAHN